MKYNQPYGDPDPNGGYKDRNTPGAVSGSKVPAAAVEFPQREIMAVIGAAGIEGSNTDLTQLLQAIRNLILEATGGGGDANYVLMTQARNRLPVFPEVLTADGRLPVVSPSAGQVRVPPGYDFLHRGIFNVTTVQADFATTPSKTYHLRWNPTNGFVLKDLADNGYNPSALPETNVIFDSAFDNMLIARVVTNASNVCTITNLANKARLVQTGEEFQENTVYEDDKTPSTLLAPGGAIININFARKPIASLTGFTDVTVQAVGSQLAEVNIVAQSLSRYQVKAIYQRTTTPSGGVVGWKASA